MWLARLLMGSSDRNRFVLLLHGSLALKMPVEQERHERIAFLGGCIFEPAVNVLLRVCRLIIAEVAILLCA